MNNYTSNAVKHQTQFPNYRRGIGAIPARTKRFTLPGIVAGYFVLILVADIFIMGSHILE